mmetsp:Transcript_13609/g.29606  ORF Transcript_13609/g.29606 Transcript_13609/m.29606 type:complete len:131 (-) Transcript_13609:2185-2577(-)
MIDPIQEDEPQDDFEESLVRAVIEEDPPDEQGIRDEWVKQTGWHRKEDIFLRRRHNKKQPDAAKDQGSLLNKIDGTYQPPLERHNISPHNTFKTWIELLVIMITCVLFVRVFRSSRRKRRTIRKKMEDIV